MLQIARSKLCPCVSLEPKNWGLRESMRRKVDDLVINASHLQPNEVHLKVMKGLTEEEIDKSTDAEICKTTKKQIMRRVKLPKNKL